MKKSLCVRMFRLVCVFAVVLAVVSLSACSKSSSKKLYLFNWTYYTPDEVIKQFEKEFGVSVKVDSYASNEEMYAKLMAGATGYDIIFPSQDYVSILIKQGKLAEIDHSKFPNKDNISDLVLAKASFDPEMKYSVPYYMGAAGIAVNKDRVKTYEKSWDIFSRTDLKDRMCMMDDMREVIGDALVSKGYSVNSLNSAELAEAKKLILTEWKPNLTKFDAEGFGKSFASGDFYVVQGYAEAVFGEVPEEKWNTVDFFIPEEGGPMYIDSLCILKNSKNYDLAMEFINFIHRPEIYAQFLDAFHFPAGVNTKAAAYMTTEPHYSAEDMKNCEIKNDLAEGIDVYNAIWQEIRFEN